MRLICPNCGAQYEVDDSVIPDQGRDVQCSNCGHTWFQQSANQIAMADNEPEIEVEDVAPPEPPQPQGLDPDVAEVLREEAEREAAQRQSESEGLETQPDLGLNEVDDDAADRTAAARARMARLRGLDEEGAPEVVTAGAAIARRNLLPDVEDVDPLIPADPTAEGELSEVEQIEEKDKRGSGRFIFRLILFVLILGIVVYLLAPQIAKFVPQAEPWLISYVDWANQLRAQINQGLDIVITRIGDLIAGVTG